MTMQSFHNDAKVKDKYLSRVKAHALADEIIKGKYWEDGKGCAVGCTIHSDDHGAYETELGIPEWLARVEDCIFEGLENGRAKTWPQEFLEAVPIGKDLNQVEAPFVIFILESNLQNFDHQKYPDVKKSIDTCIKLYRIGDLNPSAAWRAARSAAESAAWRAAESAARSAAESAAWRAAESAAWRAAESAARSAAESAAWRAARSAAESAAESAAWRAAESAAWRAAESAAWRAAESAAESAARRAAWRAAESAAWRAAYGKFADKLLELIRDCK